jgi:hypothetical protein
MVDCQVPVAHAYNPSYLGDWDRGSRPAWTNSFRDPIFKITRAKWTGGVVQVVECLLCKCEILSSNSSPTKKIEEERNDSEHNNKNGHKYEQV